MPRELTPLQESVLREARERLRAQGIAGVCLDELPDDAAIQADFDGCVQAIIDDTLLWEL